VKDRRENQTASNRYAFTGEASALFFLPPLRGFAATILAGGGDAGWGVTLTMTGAAAAGGGVATGVAGGTATGFCDSIFMMILMVFSLTV
jgi:hypothetical protein